MSIADHKIIGVKAAMATDTGAFTAIAAAYTVDRVKDRIVPGAFKSTIERWQGSGKQIPLHWDHSGEAKDIIGTVDPGSMKETEDGLYVEGQLDLEDSDVAKEAWRAMKSGAMSLSFGYLVTESAQAEDGITELKALDLFEISVVPGPANPDTRVLSMKAISEMNKSELVAAMEDVSRFAIELRKAYEASPSEETPPNPDKDAEPDGAKASDPQRSIIDRAWLEAVAPTKE